MLELRITSLLKRHVIDRRKEMTDPNPRNADISLSNSELTTDFREKTGRKLGLNRIGCYSQNRKLKLFVSKK